MSTITIEFNSPELIEAINNLARAHTAVADAFNRLVATQNSAGASNSFNSSYPVHTPEMPSSTNIKLSAAFAPTYEDQKQYTLPAKPTAQSIAKINPIMPSVPSAPHTSSNPVQSIPSHTYALPEIGISLDDLIRAAASLMGAGKYLPIVELLGRFGVQALHQLPQENFGAFAAALRQMGAQI